MQVKTLKDNVLAYGNKAGTQLEVHEEVGAHLIKLKVAEEVKAPAKKQQPKKDTPKKETPQKETAKTEEGDK